MMHGLLDSENLFFDLFICFVIVLVRDGDYMLYLF